MHLDSILEAIQITITAILTAISAYHVNKTNKTKNQNKLTRKQKKNIINSYQNWEKDKKELQDEKM